MLTFTMWQKLACWDGHPQAAISFAEDTDLTSNARKPIDWQQGHHSRQSWSCIGMIFKVQKDEVDSTKIQQTIAHIKVDIDAEL